MIWASGPQKQGLKVFLTPEHGFSSPLAGVRAESGEGLRGGEQELREQVQNTNWKYGKS